MMHGGEANIGILTASSAALNSDHFQDISLSIEDIHIRGMEGCSEFWETIVEGKRNDFDMVKLEEEICDSAFKLATEHSLNALLLECTDLCAFQSRTRQ